MDLLIKNARFTDPETGRESAVSAGIKDGKICSLQWEGESREESEGAERTVDAKGAYLLPGMIDFHTHLFTGGSAFGLNGDLLLPSGVTAPPYPSKWKVPVQRHERLSPAGGNGVF